MEDFCQLSGRLTEDKFKGSYGNVRESRLAEMVQFRPLLDMKTSSH